MTKWQPISTAPKSGEHIVVAKFFQLESMDDDQWHFSWAQIAHWFIDRWASSTEGFDGNRGGHTWFNLRQPTHWMPLANEMEEA